MAKFEINKIYQTRFISDSDCKLNYLVRNRNDKSIWIQDLLTGEVLRKKILTYDNIEYVMPVGRYSMAPMLKADREVK